MGDYNIDYFNTEEKLCLETLIVPYGLTFGNTEIPTRVLENSNTLIDYIITDLSHADTFEPIVSDTPLRTPKKAEIDNRATSVITKANIKTRSRVFIKEIFGKSNYRKEHFRELLSRSDWSAFYSQNCAEGMYTIFEDIIEKALGKCITIKRLLIGNDKSVLLLHEN